MSVALKSWHSELIESKIKSGPRSSLPKIWRRKLLWKSISGGRKQSSAKFSKSTSVKYWKIAWADEYSERCLIWCEATAIFRRCVLLERYTKWHCIFCNLFLIFFLQNYLYEFQNFTIRPSMLPAFTPDVNFVFTIEYYHKLFKFANQTVHGAMIKY